MSTIKTNNIKSLDGTVTMTVQELRAMLDAGSVGVGQTWQDVTSSRAVNTEYTNNTGKPIMIAIVQSTASTAGTNAVVVDGVEIFKNIVTTSNTRNSISFIVPDQSVYKLVSILVHDWAELR